jgi:hypothetical protein
LLPDANTPWPPKPLERVYHDLARWSAWFSGDPDELSRVYGAWVTAEKSWEARGGFVGSVSRFTRWFWGQSPKPGEQRAKLHVPLAAEIAQVSADLIFGQPPTVLCKDDDVTQQRIDELLGDRAGTQLHDAAEICSALGHVYLSVGWDREVDPTGPLLSVVDADAAYPVYRYGHLMSVIFAREWEESGSVLRHLESHEPGMIWHAAYLGDHHNLGRVVPLSAYPQTADLADAEMIADPDHGGSGIPTGLDRLAVVGVANAKSRTWRHLPAARDLGRADISGVESELDALDDVMSSWMRDVRHGRSRIHVPMHMMETQGLGKGASFDLDRELYVGLTSPPDGPLQLEATQFKIRYEEHRETATALIDRIVSGAGYSLQTFGMDTQRSTQTATESWARQIRTQHTRNGKLRAWNLAITDLIRILLLVDQAQFGGKGNPDAEIQVQFADTVSESQIVRAQTALALRTAEAASTRTLVELVHNDWEADQIDEEVLRIEHASDTGVAPVGQVQPPQQQVPPVDQSASVANVDQPGPGQ